MSEEKIDPITFRHFIEGYEHHEEGLMDTEVRIKIKGHEFIGRLIAYDWKSGWDPWIIFKIQVNNFDQEEIKK